MTWTLRRPTTAQFNGYYKLADGEPWYSDKYVLVDPNAPLTWTSQARSFVQMIDKYPKKFHSIGMHEFGVNVNGEVFDMSSGNTSWDALVLNSDKTDVNSGRAIPTSLRYLMHKHPDIRWACQFLCTKNSTGNRVEPVLDNTNNAQNTFVDHVYNVVKIYKTRFPMIKTVEIDFEKTNSRTGAEAGNNGVPDYDKFTALLVRIKNEVVHKLNEELGWDLNLRVNLFAMTGDYNPSYYAWHDYRTLALGKDKYGKQAIDEFQLMTYDFSWGGSAPGPSTPIWWLTNVLEHVKELSQDVKVNGVVTKPKVWDTSKVWIGNAGYGRRWALGEDRMGVTLDYKQLMTVQNGTYIHNSGSTNPADNLFHFNDQDFIPIAGFNDPDSDYQITYMGVYDKFHMTSNGGATFTGTNRPEGANYVTNYSRKQYPIFTNVVATAFSAQSPDNSDVTLVGFDSSSSSKISRYDRFSYSKTTSTWSDSVYVASRTAGLDMGGLVNTTTGETTVNPKPYYGYALDTAGGSITYTFNATGTYQLIALVFYPFFDQADIYADLNGVTDAIHLDGNYVEWYPFMQGQEKHFVDLGAFTFSGTNTITITKPTNGAQIWGFVVCEDFTHNLQGGIISMPVTTKPMKTRAETPAEDGTIELIDADYPTTMRLVGEILRRPPRPAIIWEDIFSSYPTTVDDVTQGFRYYPQAYQTDPTANKGFSQGKWTPIKGFTDDNPDDYSHVEVDSRVTTNGSAQLMLNKKFSGNIAVEVELRNNLDDKQSLYGIRVRATKVNETGEGFLCLLDWANGKVKIVHEDSAVYDRVIAETDMSVGLKSSWGYRLKLRAYVVDNYISFFVNDNCYFDRISLPSGYETKGAYGVWTKYSRLKLYKFNVSSLDRFERMERIKVNVEGEGSYTLDEVARDTTNYPFDKYGLITYKGYPAEISTTVANPSDEDVDEGGDANTAPYGTVLNTQIDPAYKWYNDYKNKKLWSVNSWDGTRNVTITMVDAGIWFRNFYIGDDNGMSVAYNSDLVGFVKTANMVADYGCKGIALWALGQEDPTVYTYVPDSR
jgi:spore germination protein YaaH